MEGSKTPGLSKTSNSPKDNPPPNLNPWMNRAKRGECGMTGAQKRKARECVLWLERQHGVKCLGFGTLTIPGLSIEDDRLVAENWSTLIKAFMKKLRRQLERLGLNPQGVYANEIQGKRVKAYGVTGFHCHFVCQARAKVGKKWLLDYRWVEKAWKEVLENFLGCGVDCSAATNMVGVKKSAANYLSKYLSKEATKHRGESPEIGNSVVPSTWVGQFGGLWNDVKSATEVFEGPEVIEFLESVDVKTCARLSSVHEKFIEVPSLIEEGRAFKLWVCTFFQSTDREGLVRQLKESRRRSGYGGARPVSP